MSDYEISELWLSCIRPGDPCRLLHVGIISEIGNPIDAALVIDVGCL